MNMIDCLIEKTIQLKNPTIVGLDPDIQKIPSCYRMHIKGKNPFVAVANVIDQWNRDIIDTIADIVPAVKPQMAFYEQYGFYGVEVFQKTILYAKSKGLVVIEDAKRNDIGNTAKAYAAGHLGKVQLFDEKFYPSFDADFLTVTPFLGSESLKPFIDICKQNNKGVFVLVKTSNPSAGEIQDAICKNGLTISQNIAKYLANEAEKMLGTHGYSSVGAVVGATYPDDARQLREMMPKNYFLVPGYGVQGGAAEDIVPCFNTDGLGAVVNSSRGILYAHMSDEEREHCSREQYLNSVRDAALKMREDIYGVLNRIYKNMVY